MPIPQKSSSSLKVAVIVPAKRLHCLGSFLWVQRYGPLQVVQVVKEAGYDVRLFNEEIGCVICPRTIAAEFDVVGISAKTCAISRAEEIVRQIDKAADKLNKKIVFVLGGEHASMSNGGRISDRFDFVLAGESEIAFVQILDALQNGCRMESSRPEFQPATGFFQCSAFDHVPDYQLVEGYHNTVTDWLFRYVPGLWAVRHRQIPYLSFQGSRGCPYNCSFCPTPRYLHGRHYRRRSIDSTLKYFKRHVTRGGIHRVIFEDPTAAMPFDQDAHRFFDALSRSHLSIQVTVLARLDLCEDTNLLKIMRAAGVCNLSIGIESISAQTRREFKKNAATKRLSRAIDIFHRYDFSVTGLFIVGYDTESLESFASIQRFIDRTGIAKWRVSPLCQTPEVDGQFLPPHRIFMWDELHRFGHDAADFMNGEFVFFFPRQIRPSDLQREIHQFNLSLTSWHSLWRLMAKRKRLRTVARRLGNNLAQRCVQQEVLACDYIKMLEAIEAPYYRRTTGGWVLNEGRLKEHYLKKKQKHFYRRNHARPLSATAARPHMASVFRL